MNRRTAAVTILVTLAAVLVSVLWVGPLATLSRPPGEGPTLGWLTLALMFAVTEAVVLHVQIRSEAQTLSLSEIPMVLGLAFAAPHVLGPARVLGAAAVLLLHRKQPPVKFVYNVAVQAAEVSVGIAVYDLVRGAAPPTSARGAIATLAAVVALNLLSGWCLQFVVGLSEGDYRLRHYVREAVIYPPIACGTAMFGLVALHALRNDIASVVPLLGCLVVLLLAYRLYSRLSRRHLGLERLYQFTQAVSSSPEAEQVLHSVLRQAREMANAERAEIGLLDDEGNRSALVSLGPDDVLRRDELGRAEPRLDLHRHVVGTEVPIRLRRTARTDTDRRLLRRSGYRDAICVPLPGGSGLLGTLTVANRLGDVGTFVDADLQMLVTVANHAGVAMQNGHLIDQLRHEALHDSLTGLPNRLMFERVAARELEQVGCELRGAAVGLLDLNGFKEINDTLGHHDGDQVLVEFARRLRGVLGSEGHVARLGGDEFALLLLDVDDEEQALAQAKHLALVLEAPVDLPAMQVQVQVSLGLVLAPRHGTELSMLLRRADIAMYDAKDGGKTVRLFDRELDEFSPARLTLIADLRRAVLDGELSVAVQPKVRFDNGEVTGVEALVRWNHRDHGSVSPTVFVPLAERYGLISTLTDRVLDESLAACARWLSAGRRLSVAVNLSPRALLDTGLVSNVIGALARHSVPPELLTLEITEGSVMAEPDKALAVLHALRAAGVRLSVDDFGTGYSSLSYLKRLPVQEVKIDRSFIVDLHNNAHDIPIVRSIVDLGINLGLDVVAEGIETDAIWRRLQELGCTIGQGYGIARPMPVEDLLAWLDQRARDLAVALPQARSAPDDRPAHAGGSLRCPDE
jgi:diguanylate cyclase (GGDEF)-like protein